ncbi:mitotic interactor and substrate of PLK1 isoform X2 [Alosa sapidissima]|nr:mitotic interactor and substrate of PLK1 isoform X2 [Alosa sapidissima]
MQLILEHTSLLCNLLSLRQLTFAPSRDALGPALHSPLIRSYPFPSPRPPPPPPAPPPHPHLPQHPPTAPCRPPEAEAMEPVMSTPSKPRKWELKPLSPRLELLELRSMVSPTTAEAFSFPPDRRWDGQSQDRRWDGQSQESLGFEGISVTRTQSSISVSAAPGEDLDDVVVVSRQVAVAETSGDGEAWSAGSGGSSTPSTPSTTPGTPTSSVGSHTGFYSFVDDPTSPEAEKNEEWMVSPERQAKLATLKLDSSYKLQTYAAGHKPEKLFEESNGDARYRVENTVVSRAAAEEREVVKVDRKEIIREQAPRKSHGFKEQWSALDSLDLNSAPQRLVDGFSICYSTATPAAEPTPAEPGTIDEQQIDFNSARKQFLMMEQSRGSPVVRRATDAAHSHAPTSTGHSPAPKTYTPHTLLQPHETQVPTELRRYMFAEGSGAALDDVSKESRTTNHAGRSQSLSSQLSSEDVFVSNAVTVKVSEDQDAVKRSGVTELDSGLGDQIGEDGSDASSSPPPDSSPETAAEREARVARETPIEREIRMAQEREESLRRARGIRHSSSVEMVEIKTKPLLSLPTPPGPVRAVKAKESSRVSFLIQREIEREMEREEAATGQGVAAKARAVIYDVDERRRLFEQVPSASLPSAAKQLDISQSSSGARDDSWSVFVETSEPSGAEEEKDLSPCCPHRHPEPAELPVSRAIELPSYRTRQSAINASSVLPRPSALSRSSMGAFSSASLSSLSGVGQEKESRPPPQWTRHLQQTHLQQTHLEQTHLEQTHLQQCLQNAPDLIRQDIERDLKREQEYLELRESRGRSVSLDTGLDDVDDSKQVVTTTTPTHATEPPGLKQSYEENTTTWQPSVAETAEPPKQQVLPEEPLQPVSSRSSYSWSMDTYHTRRMAPSDKPLHTPAPRPSSRLPSVSIVTAQPWGNQRLSSAVTARGRLERGRSVDMLGGPHTPTSPRGLTETLLEGFEEHRAKLKLEENAYAGIQPSDDVNHEVLEATRVTRHKNRMALRWEAGVYANEDDK